MNSVIRTQKLTKRFGDLTAVDGIDLDVHEGEVFGFLGPNGAGKTTTLRLLCALIAPTSGTAEIAGFRLGPEDPRGGRDPHRAAGPLRAAVGLGQPRLLRHALRASARGGQCSGGALPP